MRWGEFSAQLALSQKTTMLEELSIWYALEIGQRAVKKPGQRMKRREFTGVTVEVKRKLTSDWEHLKRAWPFLIKFLETLISKEISSSINPHLGWRNRRNHHLKCISHNTNWKSDAFNHLHHPERSKNRVRGWREGNLRGLLSKSNVNWRPTESTQRELDPS